MDEHHDRFEQRDQRRERVLDDVVRRLACSSGLAVMARRATRAPCRAGRAPVPRRLARRCGAGLEHSLGLHRIVSAVAPWVAPQQAPPREHQAPKYAVLPDRLDRVARARGLVLAAARDRRRDHALVDHDRRRSRPPARARRAPRRARGARRPRQRRPLASVARRIAGTLGSARSRAPSRRSPRLAQAGLGDQLRERRVDALRGPRARPARRDGRATTTTSWPGAQLASLRANASRSRRLTRLRSTAPPTLRDTDRPSRGRSAAGFGNA